MTLRQQMDQLVSLGVAELAGISSAAFGKLADGLDDDGVVCVHPDLVAPSLLAPLLRRFVAECQAQTWERSQAA